LISGIIDNVGTVFKLRLLEGGKIWFLELGFAVALEGTRYKITGRTESVHKEICEWENLGRWRLASAAPYLEDASTNSENVYPDVLREQNEPSFRRIISIHISAILYGVFFSITEYLRYPR
jgi:hypothetical protein